MAAAIAFPALDHAEATAAGWDEIQEVPCWLSAQIPVTGFKVRDLLLLQAGSVVNSKQLTGGRVGLKANGSFIAWAEFEVVNGRLGVRFTDLG
jgi:flagellar motor switch/type III secretory pathway protein FliN